MMVASESAPKRALFHALFGMEEGCIWQCRLPSGGGICCAYSVFCDGGVAEKKGG